MTHSQRNRRAPARSPRPYWVSMLAATAALTLLVAGALLMRDKPPKGESAGQQSPGMTSNLTTHPPALLTPVIAQQTTSSPTETSLSASAGSLPMVTSTLTNTQSVSAEQPADLSHAAAALLKRGDPQGAIRLYRQALEKNPEDEELHFNIGIAYAQANDNSAAEKHYREALRILPDYPEVHNNLGNLLLRLGNLQEAEQHLEQAVKLMPEYPTAHNNLGIVRQRLKKPEQALESFAQAVNYDTNYWQARFNFGNALLLSSNRDRAIVEFRETLRINPGYEPARRALERASGSSQ